MPKLTDPDTLRSSHKDTTKIVALLFLVTIVISCYLIQRGFVTSFFANRINIDPSYQLKDNHIPSGSQATIGQTQVEFLNLEFTYTVMNVFWPLVIYTLFVVVSLLLQKQTRVMQLL